MAKKSVNWRPSYFWIHWNTGISGNGKRIYVLQYETMISENKLNRYVERGDIPRPATVAAWPKQQQIQNFKTRAELEAWLTYSMRIGGVTVKKILRGDIVKVYTPR